MCRVVSLLASLAITCCASVHVHTKDGDVQVTHGIGFIRIEPASPTDAVVVTLNAVGFVSSPMGSSLGLTRQQLIMASADCRVILVIEDSAQFDAARQLMRDYPNLCIAQGNPKTNE
jgi:hypothetical protein